MTENPNNEELKNRAKELVEKHGKGAVEIARRKVGSFSKDEHCREKDVALMLLTEIENFIENKNF